MLAVIFQVKPKPGRQEAYLDIAAELRPLLAEIDGFISIERFESLAEPGKILSLSFWRDEEAIEEWRRLEKHRAAQKAGRTALFEDYSLQVVQVLRAYGMHDRRQAPPDSKAANDA
ncbi:MAG: antibiotic biosynthesis monooxygenase [Rhodovibrionaceae bacterium]